MVWDHQVGGRSLFPGAGFLEAAHAACVAWTSGGHGRAVHVDPIKLTLKAPGTKRLKLKYDANPNP